MKIITVQKNDDGKRIDAFLLKTLTSMPNSLLQKMIRTNHIKLNGKKPKPDTRIKFGDEIKLFISDEFFKQNKTKYDFLKAPDNIDIIYEDKNIIILNKKAGILCHPDNKEYIDTLLGRLQKYLYNKKEYNPKNENSFAPALVNRIDRNTQGLVIAAKNANALKILSEKLRNREIEKYYLCVCVGSPKIKSATISDYLIKNEAKNEVKIFKEPLPNSKTVITKYKVLKEKNGLSLIEAELLTGRTHQIRAHFSTYGFALLGDGKYGKNADNKKYGGYKKQLLCSYKIKFIFKSNADELNYLNGKEITLKNLPFSELF